MKQVQLPSGVRVPALGLGTWEMGDDPSSRREELAALKTGLDLGATLIDTAEMYGDGLSEKLVGEAIRGRRDGVFLVSKVYPHNASAEGLPAACERSLRRLGTDYLDLYLLHWRGGVPFEETINAFVGLHRAGKIRHFGVSNLDMSDMAEWWSIPAGQGVVTDQVLYNLVRRGVEWDLLPWLKARRVPVMAYSPLERGRLVRDQRLIELSRSWHRTPAQIALGWLLAKEDVIVIPKSSRPERVRENLAVLEQPLEPAALQELEARFPAPKGASSLEML